LLKARKGTFLELLHPNPFAVFHLTGFGYVTTEYLRVNGAVGKLMGESAQELGSARLGAQTEEKLLLGGAKGAYFLTFKGGKFPQPTKTPARGALQKENPLVVSKNKDARIDV
jgi:hypothetical protein